MSGFQREESILDGFGALSLIFFFFCFVFLAFGGTGCESGITCTKSRGCLGDLIRDIVGVMLFAIVLKMATISWSEIVCCAKVELQKELFEANTRLKTGLGTKTLDPSSVVLYSYPSELSSPELYVSLQSTVQTETPYTVRQGIPDRLVPDQSPSPRGTTNADD